VSFQGANLMCQRNEITNEEIFMLEFQSGKWAFRSCQELYISGRQALTVDSKTRGDTELFELEFHEDKVAIKYGGKYLNAKPLGGIDLAGSVNPQALFHVVFHNRPQIVFLTGNQTFVTASGGLVRTNKTLPEVFDFEFRNGPYAVKAADGKFLRVGAENRVELAAEAELFFLEFHQNKLALKTNKGKYLEAENGGYLVAKADKPDGNALYEF